MITGNEGFALGPRPARPPCVVVIPTRDHADDYCVGLVQQLLEQGEADKILVYDNRDEPEFFVPAFDFDERVLWRASPGQTITQMWNHGWGTGVVFGLDGPVNVAILNDDISVPPGFLGHMADELRSHDDCWLVCPDYDRALEEGTDNYRERHYVTGTYGQGGVCGWAFMIRGELLGNPLPPIDEQFIWWYGDDDLVMQIGLHGGKCAKIKGLPVSHVGTATGKLYPHLAQVAEEDGARFRTKYQQ